MVIIRTIIITTTTAIIIRAHYHRHQSSVYSCNRPASFRTLASSDVAWQVDQNLLPRNRLGLHRVQRGGKPLAEQFTRRVSCKRYTGIWCSRAGGKRYLCSLEVPCSAATALVGTLDFLWSANSLMKYCRSERGLKGEIDGCDKLCSAWDSVPF